MSYILRLLSDHKRHKKSIAKFKQLYELQRKELEKKQEELRENIDKQKQIQKYKNEYEHLRKQLTMVETDLKNSYERYRVSVEPEFLKRRELEFIARKLQKLRKERLRVMKLLKREYNVRTKCSNVSHKLQKTNNEYINTQNRTIRTNKKEIKKMNDTIQMKDRLASIHDYNVNTIDRNINIAIAVLILILVCLVPTLLAFVNLLSGKLALLAIVLFSIIGGVVIFFKYKKIPHRSKRIWELRNYKEPSDKKEGEEILEETQEEIDNVAEGNTVEDILANELAQTNKCS